MKFLVIDNQGGELDSLIFVLKRCYDDCEVLPERGGVTENWTVAEALITKAANEPEQIIFLDLALETNAADEAGAGLQRVTNIFTRRPEATWIAYTSYSEILATHEAKRLFHGILDKQRMTQLPVAERERLVRRAVDDAIRKRRGSIQAEPITHEDSAGMRSFFAIYPKYALEELMAAECAGWSDQKVCALSSGYSGSSLLQITGLKDAAPKQIVIKLAPRRDVIEAETHVLDDKYRGEGGVYAGKCAQPSQLKDLPEKLGFYSIQESVPGRTLMSLLTDEAVSKDMAKAALRTVIDLSVEQYKRGWYAKKVDEHEKKLKRFEFTEIDIDRARQACAFLRDIGHALSTRAQWPRTAAKVEQVFSVIEHLLSTWQSNLSRAAPFEWVLQHGDLNPHNIMIGAAGQITFIDLARIGHWPVGYDLSRLAIQLRMRLVDRAGTADWFGDHLTDWYEEPIWAIGNEANPHPLCWPAALCEQALTEFVNTREEEGRAVLYTGSRVGALFDLLRILSYNDLSPFKRLWAALGCFDLASRLGWLP